MSNSWLSDYTSALDARDAREKAQDSFIAAYTRLADRTARLESERAAAPPPPASPKPTSTKNKPSPSRFGRSSPANTTESDAAPTDVLSRLRADLTATQTSRASLQAQLSAITAELTTLKAKAARDAKQVMELLREKAGLERKLRDRESEIKGKGRLVEDVQDELVSLNLQFNMAEQRAEKLESENKELVQRWMNMKREEADKMNDISKWE